MKKSRYLAAAAALLFLCSCGKKEEPGNKIEIVGTKDSSAASAEGEEAETNTESITEATQEFSAETVGETFASPTDYDTSYFVETLSKGEWTALNVRFVFDTEGNYRFIDGDELEEGTYSFGGTDVDPTLILKSGEYAMSLSDASHMKLQLGDRSFDLVCTSGTMTAANSTYEITDTAIEGLVYPLLNCDDKDIADNFNNTLSDDIRTIAEGINGDVPSATSVYDISYSDNDIFSVVIHISEYYEGAAHPMNTARCYTFSVKDNKFLFLEDIADTAALAEDLMENKDCLVLDAQDVTIDSLKEFSMLETADQAEDYMKSSNFFIDSEGRVNVYFETAYVLGSYVAVLFENTSLN